MFLLDTNVLSAMMAAQRVPEVAAWMAGQSSDRMFTAAVCQAEILTGLAIMPLGRRRTALEAAAEAMFREDFRGRIWPFDSAAATAYADFFAIRRQAGRPIATIDLMIAAIARSRGATVVTRNVADFAGYGLPIADPWTSVR